MVSIGAKVKHPPARKALEFVRKAVPRPRPLYQILQGTTAANVQEGSLTNNFNELTDDITKFPRFARVETFCEPIALWA
jgi:hypothetical protein